MKEENMNEIEKQVVIANQNIETLAAYLDAHPEVDIPSTYQGLSCTIGGVRCISYSSGVIRVAPPHLPTGQINYERIAAAVERHRSIRRAAQAMIEQKLIKSNKRLWAHDGSKFVRVA